MSDCRPIGVFDSGVGGLTVARELRARFPAESLLYFADTAWVPYGDRQLDVIRQRVLAVGDFLQRAGVKALVVACNTACGAGLEVLRAQVPLPVVGIEPAIKPAVSLTRNGRIGVMATDAMLRSARFRRLLDVHATGVEVLAQPCPGLVELVESGDTGGPAVRQRMEVLLEPFGHVGVDTVVLGCTHYPLLANIVREVLGPDVILVESGAAVARQTERVLAACGSLCSDGIGEVRAVVTGEPLVFAASAQRLCREPMQVAVASV